MDAVTYLVNMFLRTLMVGFIIELPVVGPLMVAVGAGVILWAYNTNIDLYNLIMLSNVGIVFNEDAVLSIIVIGGIGLGIGYWAGGEFKKQLKPILKKIKDGIHYGRY